MAKIVETALAMLMFSLAWSGGLAVGFGLIAFALNGFHAIGNERMSDIFSSTFPLAILCAGVNMALVVEKSTSVSGKDETY